MMLTNHSVPLVIVLTNHRYTCYGNKTTHCNTHCGVIIKHPPCTRYHANKRHTITRGVMVLKQNLVHIIVLTNHLCTCYGAHQPSRYSCTMGLKQHSNTHYDAN